MGLSPQGRRLARCSLRPHLGHAQVASGCVGWGSAGGWGDNGETAKEEPGRLGFRHTSRLDPAVACLFPTGMEQVRTTCPGTSQPPEHRPENPAGSP